MEDCRYYLLGTSNRYEPHPLYIGVQPKHYGLGKPSKLPYFVVRKLIIERMVCMLKEFERWLVRQCPWYYLLSQEQEEEYFSQWFDEVCRQRKESAEHEKMV